MEVEVEVVVVVVVVVVVWFADDGEETKSMERRNSRRGALLYAGWTRDERLRHLSPASQSMILKPGKESSELGKVPPALAEGAHRGSFHHCACTRACSLCFLFARSLARSLAHSLTHRCALWICSRGWPSGRA